MAAKRSASVLSLSDSESSSGDAAVAEPSAKRSRAGGRARAAGAKEALTRGVSSSVGGVAAGGGIEDGYFPGSIKRITLHNFVTYNDVEFVPGPRLNTIIGPNGSGKSTIVCAILVGLAGNIKKLGRMDDLGDFIQNGKSSGSVEIELAGGEDAPDTIIKRLLKRTEAGKVTSDWRVDGAKKSETFVKELVRSLNIQLDNLCQFLPQERVADFAKLNAQELLVETQRAVGKADLMDIHNELIELQKEDTEFGSRMQEKELNLAELKREFEALDQQVKSYEVRGSLESDLALHEGKIPHAKYWLAKEEYEAHKARASELKAEFQRRMAEYAPLEAAAQEAEKVRVASQKKLARESKALEKIFSAVYKTQNELPGLGHETVDIQRQIEVCNSEEAEAAQVIAGKERELTVAQAKLEAFDEESLRAEAQEAHAQQRAAKSRHSEVENRKRVLVRAMDQAKRKADAAERDLGRLSATSNRRMEALEKSNMASAVAARRWLDANRQRFRGEVYGPVILEMSVPDSSMAAYVETQLSNDVKKAFVFVNTQDEALFKRELKAKNMYRGINTLTLGRAGGSDRAGPKARPDLGLFATVDDLFDAPAAVKEVIRDMAGSNQALVGDESALEHLDAIRQLGVRRVYIGDTAYGFRRSKYGNNHISTNSFMIPASRFLTINTDHAAVARAEKAAVAAKREQMELEEERNRIQRELDDALQEQRRWVDRKQELQNSMREGARLNAQIRKIEDAIELERGRDFDSERDDLRKDLKRLLMKRWTILKSNRERLKEIAQKSRQRDLLMIEGVRLKAEAAKLAEAVSQASSAQTELRRQVENEEAAKKTKKAEARELKAIADATMIPTEEVLAKWQEIPDAVADLEALVYDMKVRIRAMSNYDPAVVTRHEEVGAEIAALQATVDNYAASKDAHSRKMERLRASWEPALEQIVDAINRNYAVYFERINCAGEVRLYRDESDFAKWGIEIWVKFRAIDRLARLTAHHQSGGERSVSTMLYLIALQELTPCPFRLVDEINQGMDVYNERRIFNQIVASACQPGLPQYFLITPKLLPDLTYTEDTTVLCVFNGPWQSPGFDDDKIFASDEPARKRKKRR